MSEAGEFIQLSVVVPTFNERDNVEAMLRRLDGVLSGIRWELIFVDDFSPDGTADVVRELARSDRRVRLIARHNRRGLSSAVVEGALAAAGDVIAVMDGDLQHDEKLLPRLYDEVASGKTDIASASRFLAEASADGLSSESRKKMSDTGIRMANWAFDLDLTDPLTGFFVARRSTVTEALPQISGEGFKILLDLITASPVPPRVTEFPLTFRPRLHGESKLDARVMYDFFLFMIERKLHPVLPIPVRLISFGLINTIGIAVHLVIFEAMVAVFAAGFALAQFVGTFISMMFNYSVNNAVTYSDQKLRGRKFYFGFLIFCVLCSVGIVANIGVANMLHERYAGLSYLLPAFAGALIGVVWNYAATRTLVWGRTSRKKRRAMRRSLKRRAQDDGGSSPSVPVRSSV